MKIVVISDTHEQEERVNLPEGDILIHSGDWTYKGAIPAMEKFLTWFSNQSHTYKIFIAGNHELGLDAGPAREAKQELIKSFCDKNSNLFYLEESGINIDGINYYGSPTTPWFHSWAFNVSRGPEIAKKWALIQEDTNVLITHGPPYGILDFVENECGEYEHKGCEELRKKVDSMQKHLKLHIFGHLHLKGCTKMELNDTIFANAAICDEDYNVRRTPLVIEID